MKFSIALFPAFVVFIQASPTGSASFSIDIKVDDELHAHNQVGINQVCFKACWPEEPTCPDGWESKQLGECWTCCVKEDQTGENDDELQTYVTQKHIGIKQDICWAICAPDEIKCPEGWYDKQFGDLTKGNDVPLISGKELAKFEGNHELQTYITQKHIGIKQACWLVCAPDEIKCPEGLDPKQFGEESLAGTTDVPLISGKQLAKLNFNHGLQTHITPKQIGIKQGIWILSKRPQADPIMTGLEQKAAKVSRPQYENVA
ncbi:MAG: hypothetical protein LQ342_003572 [Letrouitia transgressa]|nr:MAG: hypothetical protein LQ342_003572 [Letrouitia transgressa]